MNTIIAWMRLEMVRMIIDRVWIGLEFFANVSLWFANWRDGWRETGFGVVWG